MNAALDQVKQRMAAKTLTLVGYSGGGAVAVLLAARRSDIDQLITVAGNLDTVAWTRHHALSPLTGSLNPADEAERLMGIRQIHWVGVADETIPPLIAESYAARFMHLPYPEINILQGYSHQCCWVKIGRNYGKSLNVYRNKGDQALRSYSYCAALGINNW